MGRIMVVDDFPKIREIIKRMLETEGHEIIEAESGKKCLEILKKDKPDLILLDIMMPGMDGWETVGEIRKDISNAHIKISMLSIRSTEKDKAKSLEEVGADWHIPKPVTKNKLLEAVDWLLSKESDKKELEPLIPKT